MDPALAGAGQGGDFFFPLLGGGGDFFLFSENGRGFFEMT